MRALFHHPHHEWTGAARAFATAARGLAARGWQVTFACCPDGEAQRHAAALGLPVYSLAAGEGVMGSSGSLARALREQFVEVVFVHGERAQLAAAGATWRASRGAVVRRFCAGETPQLSRTARTAMRTTATGFLCTWPEQAGALPENAAQLGVVVADLGVGADATPPERRDAVPHKRIVCVYERAARARLSTLLRAVAMLAPRHPELRVALVGPGSDDEELRLHAAALGVNRVIAHLGDRSDAAELFDEADLGWVVADGDDGAYGVLDCLSAGVPVLVERGSDAARYVPDALGGVHLEPGDAAGTAAVVAQLLAHAGERQAIGAAGRARVARTYTEAAMLDGFARAATGARDRTRWRT